MSKECLRSDPLPMKGLFVPAACLLPNMHCLCLYHWKACCHTLIPTHWRLYNSNSFNINKDMANTICHDLLEVVSITSNSTSNRNLQSAVRQ